MLATLLVAAVAFLPQALAHGGVLSYKFEVSLVERTDRLQALICVFRATGTLAGSHTIPPLANPVSSAPGRPITRSRMPLMRPLLATMPAALLLARRLQPSPPALPSQRTGTKSGPTLTAPCKAKGKRHDQQCLIKLQVDLPCEMPWFQLRWCCGFQPLVVQNRPVRPSLRHCVQWQVGFRPNDRPKLFLDFHHPVFGSIWLIHDPFRDHRHPLPSCRRHLLLQQVLT